MLDLWQFLRIIADRPTYVVQLVAEGWILFFFYLLFVFTICLIWTFGRIF